MVRTMLESLVSDRGGKRPPKKDLDQQHLTEIDNFHKMSFFWSYLLNFSGKIYLLFYIKKYFVYFWRVIYKY